MIYWSAFPSVFGRVCIDFFVKTVPPVILFCLPYKRMPNFRLRVLVLPVFVLIYSALITLIGLFIASTESDIQWLYIQYLFLMLGVFVIQRFLYQCSVSSLLFNLLGGFSIYQISLFLYFLISSPIFTWTGLSPTLLEDYILQAIWTLVAYLAAYHTFIKKQNTSTGDDIDGKYPALYLSVAIALFLIEFNLVRNSSVDLQSELNYMCIICLILFYTLILFLRSGLLSIMHTKKEILLTQKAWEEKKKSLKFTAETANAINIKYHDLKHILSKLTSEDTHDLVAELTDSLSAYSHTISTGNDTLDLVLTEQTIHFNQTGVAFSCIADGQAISFMHSLDIISLFSNALDNAFEAVITLEKSKQEIYLTIKRAVGMVSICVENPYDSTLTLQNGLPITTKADKEHHGFGMKSIRSTVEKYDGCLSISTDDGWFRLKILIPER